MKSKHEYGNHPEEYSEDEEEIAEDVNFKKENLDAKAAFLSDQHHEDIPGNVTLEGVQREPPLEVMLHTDFIERRNAAVTDRRHVEK